MLKLIDSDISSNFINPRDCLFITGNWTNTSSDFFDVEIFPFIDLEFGYQRIPEGKYKKSRFIGEYFPKITQLRENEITPVTLSYNVPTGNYWAGTYNLYIGFCDASGESIKFVGEANMPVSRQFVGSVEFSWGWGRAHIDLLKKPIHKCINSDITTDNYLKPIYERTFIADDLHITLCKNIPLILGYSYKEFNTSLKPMLPEILVRDYNSDSLFCSYMNDVVLDYKLTEIKEKSAVYKCCVNVKSIPVVYFCINFNVIEKTLKISVDSVHEEDGFEFLELRYYDLACLAGDAKMADLIGGGREISLQNARNMFYTKNYDVHNCAALYDENGIIILEDFCLDNKIHTAVDGYGKSKQLSMGSTITLKVAGAGKMKSVPVQQSDIEVSVFSDEYGTPGWLALCKYIRRNLKGINRELYSKTLHYVIYSSQGPEPYPWQVNEDSPYEIARLLRGIKFTNLIDEVKKLYNVSDGYRQIPFVYGYFKQSDNRELYWDVYTPDCRAGTLEEFKSAIKEARDFNTDIALYENYDDVYAPTVDSSFAALDKNGQPWQLWLWADGESKALSFKKYFESGEMQKRVKKMMDIYGDRRTGYIDVLSSEVLRWDFNPEVMASAQTSLKYKYKLIDEYNKHKMDVYSETLVHPYVGKIGYAVSTRTDRNIYYENEQFIPMINGIYHGTVGYCFFNEAGGRTDMLFNLLMAGSVRFEIDDCVNYDIVKWIYLQQIPMGLIEDEYLEDYIEDGTCITLKYTNDTYIIIDVSKLEYEIIYNNITIAKNWTTFVPSKNNDGYLAYSLKGDLMEYDFPEDMCVTETNILTFEGSIKEKIEYKTEKGKISLTIPADKPVKLTINKINS